ncbi:DinB family protein [Deinococcus altitudinis]|uniref:DinB family protein n=1 Tax=Deinococcus altitudinis TaxID=468914 RepID=UPI003891E6CB
MALLLAVLHEARARTLATVSELKRGLDDSAPGGHSAGTLLYHIAAIELDWLYAEVRQEAFPAEAEAWFPLDVRGEGGRLNVLTGEGLERHLARLTWVRGLLDGTFASMSVAELRRPRELEAYTVTPEWVLMHLALHEAHHVGQLALLH